ncbi:hypothetical protein GCM10018987_01260 [Streptomyces cremeus]
MRTSCTVTAGPAAPGRAAGGALDSCKGVVEQGEAFGGAAAGPQDGLGPEVLDDPVGGLHVGVGGGACRPGLDGRDERYGGQGGQPHLPVEREHQDDDGQRSHARRDERRQQVGDDGHRRQDTPARQHRHLADAPGSSRGSPPSSPGGTT